MMDPTSANTSSAEQDLSLFESSVAANVIIGNYAENQQDHQKIKLTEDSDSNNSSNSSQFNSYFVHDITEDLSLGPDTRKLFLSILDRIDHLETELNKLKEKNKIIQKALSNAELKIKKLTSDKNNLTDDSSD